MQKLTFQSYFGLILIYSFVASCVPAPIDGGEIGGDAALLITFETVYDTLPVTLGNADDTFLHNGDLIYFTDFRFFVSNVGLENQTSRDLTTVIDDDEVWQFKPNESTEDFLTQPGEYKGIRLDFGVPAELNTSAFDPNAFGSASPLSDSDNFSLEFESYKFFELRGEVVRAGGRSNFNYRIGKDQFYTASIELFAKSVILKPETNDISFNFTIDLKKVLEGVTISENLILKESDLPTLGQKIMTNFTENSIKLE